ncbi:putative Zinc finger, SWIM-type [Lupinus albus]|uniref:Putative Zinc finger, SWIM-type n=1 Tax=Lupinus albus TaxID=3870 RepID=A0A6A4NI29_LUPAL|nr:putative Zinc finger, SWIM-type [Lupinus albus]
MFRHLGWVLYCTRCGPNAMDTVEEFMQIFVDQCAFMDYFKSHWLASIDLWINGIKILPVSTPEPHAGIESYHIKLKSMLLKENCANFWSRIDWLIHTLTTKLHSAYWLDQYSLQTGYFENLRDSSLSTSAWHNALDIPDADVILDEQNLHIAKVLSRADRSFVYTVWNPGSEFSLCDCSWSRLGNLCKHVIKVATFCRNRQVARPLMSAQIYKQALLTLLHNPPDDPLVLDHTILHVARLQEDIKALEDLSNIGLLQPLAPDLSSQMAENSLFFQRLQ